MRAAAWMFGVAATAVAAIHLFTTTTSVHAQGAPPSGQQWSGTVTVTRNASGSLKAEGAQGGLGYSASETITFHLGPDGVASYTANFRHKMDLAGEYSIPTIGSGSGSSYYSAGFNGRNWEVSIDGNDSIPTETDYTAQDMWWATHFLPDLAKLAEALGEPKPSYSPRVEKGGRGVNGVAFAADGAATAKSLSGSRTERLPSSGPEGLEGLPNIPMTVTVSWNLTLGPVQPKVAIHGPDCGCLDSEHPESTELKFRAGATVRGGEFSEFEIVPEGKTPEIVSNQGGEQPELILTATKDTGAVTLKIHYTKDGRRYDAPPQRVEFCTVEKIELKDDERDLAFNRESLVVNAKTKAWHNGEEVSREVSWDLEKMGAPTRLSSDPANAKAEKIQFTYEGLPEKNDSFGPRTLTAQVARGKCSCQERETIRTFFVGGDVSHPGDDSPNWFYYWSQTGAITAGARAILRYQESLSDRNLPDARPIAMYDHDTQRILISDIVFEQHGCRAEVDRASHAPTGRRGEGIDCFAETVRHEWQHRQDAIDWWGTPAGPAATSVAWFAKDWDHDQVPNEVEDREPGCKSGSTPAITLPGSKETWFTCSGRPFPDATDAEINAYWVGWTWPVGSVNSSDWVCGPLGKQWHGRACGSD